MIVLDASVLANAVGDDTKDGDHARDILRGAGDIAVPDLADVETASVLRRRWQAGDIDAARFSAALDDLMALPLTRYPARPLLRRVFELRGNVTPYDACYVALAESLDCPLYTADTRLAKAPGPTCHIELVN
ncbi:MULTISPECIES: type II toxin-antitoxin system VapC family toxin [unclassified Frankia]|uniref:type II toxin-antitoxin system VapC family toxin n=1 Tax=unclassified Frankia TaxID=2632575 RepID=UPI0020256805